MQRVMSSCSKHACVISFGGYTNTLKSASLMLPLTSLKPELFSCLLQCSLNTGILFWSTDFFSFFPVQKMDKKNMVYSCNRILNSSWEHRLLLKLKRKCFLAVQSHFQSLISVFLLESIHMPRK